MFSFLPHDVFQLPTVQRFLDRVVDDLIEGKSPVVLLPLGIEPEDVWAQVFAKLDSRRFTYRSVYVSDLPSGAPPVSSIANELGISWPDPTYSRTPSNLIKLMHDSEILDIICLREVSVVNSDIWLQFLHEWNQENTRLVDQDKNLKPKPLLIIDEAASILGNLPNNVSDMTIRWWWGIPTSLEMRLLCRTLDSSESTSISGNWREHLIPSLSGNDVSFAEYLGTSVEGAQQELFASLRDFGIQMKWDAGKLEEWGANIFLDSRATYLKDNGSVPPREFRRLWANGVLWHTPEFGLELHSAALSLMDRGKDFQRRVWRAQIELLSPIVDDLRVTICGDLTQAFGGGWPLWIEPKFPDDVEDLRNDPYTIQWGHLEHLLEHCPQLRNHDPSFLKQVKTARRIRNYLYHYKVIQFSDFDRLSREMKYR